MCTVHGWPLYDKCGGNPYTGSYWSSDQITTSKHYNVGMASGTSLPNDDTVRYAVPCVL